MADFMVYYKNYQRDVEERGLSSEIDWHTSHEPTFNALKQGDDVWVIVRDPRAGWRLLQRLRVESTQTDPDRDSFVVREYGAYHVIGDPGLSKRFDIDGQIDLEAILQRLQFSTGIGLHASGAQIGNSFQGPRALSEADAKMLRELETTLSPPEK
jgi:hypothetical protein